VKGREVNVRVGQVRVDSGFDHISLMMELDLIQAVCREGLIQLVNLR